MSLEIDDALLIKLLSDDDGKAVDDNDFKEWRKRNGLEDLSLQGNGVYLQLYNKVNYDRGILDQLQEIRRTPESHSIEEMIDILHTAGYTRSSMVYLLYKYGYSGMSMKRIRTYLERNRFKLRERRREFMNAIATAKEEVFQIHAKKVKDAESKTIQILLSKMEGLQSELENIDPVADSPKFNRVLGLITKIQNQINEAHGITSIRQAYIDVEKQKAIDDHRFDIDMKKFDYAEKQKNLGSGNNNIIEADSAFVIGG